MKLAYFHSHYPLICKEGIIYSQALRYNMTLSKDHTLQKELNNHTSIFLTHAYAMPHHQKRKNSSSLLAVICFLKWHHICQSFLRHRQIIYKHHTWKLLWRHTVHNLAIQTFIHLHKIQHYSQPSCLLYTNIWLLATQVIIYFLHLLAYANTPVFIKSASCSLTSALTHLLLCTGQHTHMYTLYTWDISTITHIQ